MEAITFWDKLLSPLPFLLWIPIVLAGVLAVLWAVDKWLFRKTDIIPEIRNGNVAMALVVVAIVWVVTSVFARATFGATAEYDRHFKRAAVTYFGSDYAWQQFKAQGMTESALRPRVCSSVGACGLMQIMPGTARELRVDPFRPRAAIWAALKYDRRLWRQFTDPRPAWDRLAFAYMSYNAGLGNVLKFQRRASADGNDPNRFGTLAPYVWDEPREYVERIGRWCARFGGWGCGAEPPGRERGRC